MNLKKLRGILLNVAKLLFAGGLIYYLVSQDKLDVQAVYNARYNWPYLLAAFSILFSTVFICCFRWHILLTGQDVRISAKKIIYLTFVGLFFSAVLPGAVSGDIIKSAYIAKENPGKKAAVVLTVILDRVLGLFAMIVISLVVFGLFVVTNNPALQHDSMRQIGIIIALLCGAFLLVFALGLSKRIVNSRFVVKILSIIPFGRIITGFVDGFHLYRKNLNILIFALGISFAGIIINCFAFLLLGYALNFHELSFFVYLLIIPLGMLLIGLPIAPVGIGVGQAVLLKLFEWSLGKSTTFGADIVTLWQALIIVIYLSGAFFYLNYKSEMTPAKNEVTETP